MYWSMKDKGLLTIASFFIPIKLSTWMYTAIAAGSGAALSAYGSSQANKRIRNTANANAYSTMKQLEQSYGVNKNQLLGKAEEVNNQLGMELTNLIYSSAKTTGAVTTATAERNVYGNTAGKIQNTVEMKKSLTADQIQQAAESKLVDIQNELRNAKYSYESGNIQNGINYNNAMMNVKSGTEVLAGSLSTGLSLGSSAHSLAKA